MAETSAAEDTWAVNCILCKKPLGDTVTTTVKATGIKNFIKSSKQRGDKQVEEVLRDRHVILVHDTCSKTYNSKKSLKYSTVTTQTQPSTSTRSTNVDFDFKNNCFFCGRLLYTKKHRADSVSHVTNVKFRETLLTKYANLESTKVKEFRNRISLVPCLVKAGAGYHKKCLKYPPFDSNVKAPYTSEQDVFDIIINYISDRPDEAQFCLGDIFDSNKSIEESPHLPTLKYKLQNKFQSEFVVQVLKGDIIISRMSLARFLLSENFCNSRLKSTDQEKFKKIDESSALCLKDIESMKYDTTFYPPQDKFLQDSNKLVPESLRRHLYNIIAKHKTKPVHWDEVINSIGHAIIAAAKPTSFVSPVLVNLASVLHRMFGSKELIDLLHSNGFCTSYKEVRRLLSSVINHEEQHEYNDAFTQLVFDNADHNVETADGRNTFHVMGGIQIITPKSAVSESQSVLRLKNPLTAEELAERGKIVIQTFQKRKEGGFKNIKFEDIDEIHEIPKEIKLSKLDFFWQYGRSISEQFPGYHGFMEKVTKKDSFAISKIKILPFINAPASHPDTIYTSLLEAEKLRKKLDQEHMFVTFDSPLFWKGQEIQTHVDLDKVILKLGGFHLWFSFTSSIYYIMNGSGLRELFCEMFAENSCDKVLNGCAYTRSVRAHLLMHAVLGKLIMDACVFSDEEKEILNHITSKQGPELREYLENVHFNSAYQKFHDKLVELETRGPTAQLWILYFKLLTIMKLFIEAERSGNWDLHLESCHRMVPIFHATGHFHYAKCLLLYLLQMVNLCKKLTDLQNKQDRTEVEDKERIELERYTKMGYFTIRRTDKFWSGVWSDMVIEQSLMRLIKTRGGLTHGRGVTPSVQTQWTLSTPALVDMSEQLQTYSNVSFATSEQHKDSRPTRMKKDYEDLLKILNFFNKNNPFPVATVPVSLSTGIMGDASTNCYKALEVGKQLVREQVKNTKTFDQIKFFKKKQVVSLQAAAGKIIVDAEDVITANPTLIFQRITIAVNNNQNLMKYLAFKLAPYPVALFENGIMCKTEKAKFTDNFRKIDALPPKVQYVIDGGYLLHKVVWPREFGTGRNITYGHIANLYVTYLHEKYPDSNITVAFDGYENIGTKSAERIRRKATGVCREIDFSEQTPLSKNQADFFSNDDNKSRFILQLMGTLKSNKIDVLQAKEDADTLIVETAIDKSTKEEPSVIVGSDTDLLVIMTQRTPFDKKVYFLKDVKGDIVLYDSDSFTHKHLKSLVAFLHAFSGCDTTSAFYFQGKNKLLKVLLKNEQLASKLAIFNNPEAEKSEITEAGNLAIMAMYGAKKKQNMDLNTFRHHCYEIGVKNKATFDLKSLPPSESAAICHSYRVYYQVQLWFGRSDNLDEVNDETSLNPTNWGWKFVNNMYKPVYVIGNLLPDEILKSIRCSCKKGCKSNCGCKKHGLKYSDFCGYCKGHSCENKQEPIDMPEENQAVDGEEDEVESLVEQNEQISQSHDIEITYDVPTQDELGSSDENESDIEEDIININSTPR